LLSSITTYTSHCLLFTVPSPPSISPLSLHDALPIFHLSRGDPDLRRGFGGALAQRDEVNAERGRQHDHVDALERRERDDVIVLRSEEHTSELQSRVDLVCRLLLEKKTNTKKKHKKIT